MSLGPPLSYRIPVGSADRRTGPLRYHRKPGGEREALASGELCARLLACEPASLLPPAGPPFSLCFFPSFGRPVSSGSRRGGMIEQCY